MYIYIYVCIYQSEGRNGLCELPGRDGCKGLLVHAGLLLSCLVVARRGPPSILCCIDIIRPKECHGDG